MAKKKKPVRKKAAAKNPAKKTAKKKSPRNAAPLKKKTSKKASSAKKKTPKKTPAKKKAAAAKKPARKRPAGKPSQVPAPVPVSSMKAAPAPPAPERPQTPFVDRGEPIPTTYGGDTLTALVRDPSWIFVYWELEGTKREEVAKSCGPEIYNQAQWILRVKDLADGGLQDIPVLLDSKNWYVNVRSRREYQVELGIMTSDHGFIPLLRSNTVRTPGAGVSDEIDEKWMVKDEDFRKFLTACEGRGAGTAGGKVGEFGVSSSGLPVHKKKK